MRKLLALAPILALAALLWTALPQPLPAQVGPPNTIQCNGFAPFTGTGTTSTFITGVSGKIVAICGWHVTTSSSASLTFQFVMGTAANCVGGTSLTPALQITSSAPSADHVDYASLSTPAGQNVCVNANSAVTGGLWFAQF